MIFVTFPLPSFCFACTYIGCDALSSWTIEYVQAGERLILRNAMSLVNQASYAVVANLGARYWVSFSWKCAVERGTGRNTRLLPPVNLCNLRANLEVGRWIGSVVARILFQPIEEHFGLNLFSRILGDALGMRQRTTIHYCHCPDNNHDHHSLLNRLIVYVSRCFGHQFRLNHQAVQPLRSSREIFNTALICVGRF